MADSRDWTDKELEKMEKKIDSIYREAESGIREKWDAYMERAEKRIERYENAYNEAVKSGNKDDIEKAEKELKRRKENVTIRNEYYQGMVEETTDRLAQTNEIALSYMNDQIPTIYRRVYNWAEPDEAKINVRLNVRDENTVKRMIKDGDIKLPYKKLDIPKDKRWNTKQLNSSVLQGILQGESIPKISKRILPIVDNNKSAAVRNARTMVTGAENGGKADRFKDLQDRGVVMRKVWIATPDSRTRDFHLSLDGQERELDEPFIDGNGNELQYPADPDAAPETVYNCRCSMISDIIGFRKANGEVVRIEDYEDDDTMHEEQIAREQERRGVEPQSATVAIPQPVVQQVRIESEKLKSIMSEEDYKAYMDLANGSEVRVLYDKYDVDDMTFIRLNKNGGAYSPSVNGVDFSYRSDDGMSKYGTLAHENSHFFDAQMGRVNKLNYNEIDLINEAYAKKNPYRRLKAIKETPSASDEFLGALREDMKEISKRPMSEVYKELRATQESRNASAGVQDALDGFYSTQKQYYGWGHGDSYYNRVYNHKFKDTGTDVDLKEIYKQLGFDASNQTKVKKIARQYEAASEAWANIGSAVTCGGAELEATEKYMPKTLAAFRKIIKEATE